MHHLANSFLPRAVGTLKKLLHESFSKSYEGQLKSSFAQSARAVEYTDCTFAEG